VTVDSVYVQKAYEFCQVPSQHTMIRFFMVATVVVMMVSKSVCSCDKRWKVEIMCLQVHSY
jgi:hypothetical protein